jgi:hypothetical protein
MKRVMLLLAFAFSFVLGIGLGSISHSAAEEVKLIADEGEGQDQMCADVFRNSVIVGVHSNVSLAKIYVHDGKKWKERAELTAAVVADNFGFSVAINGPRVRGAANIAIVGAPQHDGAGDDSGAAYVFTRSGDSWKRGVKLVADDAAAADTFGYAVSIDRNTAIVGSPKHDAAGSNSGAAYIFAGDDFWNQQAKLVPKDLEGRDTFGASVFVRARTAVVGAPAHTHSGIKSAGAAYVFVREGETWREQAKLTPDDAAKRDRFGHSVAMNISSDTIIVGAPFHDTERGVDAGAAYIFALDGDTWKQQAKLTIKSAGENNQLGSGVATTGKIAILGAKRRDEGDRASGAAYAFVRVDGVWEEREQVTPLVPIKQGLFGFWVAMSENTVVISAHSENIAGPGGFGADGAAAYVYNSIEDFGTPPFAVEPFGLRLTTLGQVKRTALYQNFPNPFNPETWMPYRLVVEAPVTFRIYNVQGQLTRELNLGTQKAGGYLTRQTAAYWDGRDGVGETVSSGVYFYTLQAGPFQATRRMLILK